jgi:hypothetical protein
MNARVGSLTDCFPGFIDIALHSARQTANDRYTRTIGRITDFNGNAPNSFQVIRRSRRKACFHDIHSHACQGAGDFHFLGSRHGRARRLLAVAQGGVKYSNISVDIFLTPIFRAQ